MPRTKSTVVRFHRKVRPRMMRKRKALDELREQLRKAQREACERHCKSNGCDEYVHQHGKRIEFLKRMIDRCDVGPSSHAWTTEDEDEMQSDDEVQTQLVCTPLRAPRSKLLRQHKGIPPTTPFKKKVKLEPELEPELELELEPELELEEELSEGEEESRSMQTIINVYFQFQPSRTRNGKVYQGKYYA